MLGKALLPNIGEHLSNLTHLFLASNAFEGLIPVSLGNALGLEVIDLSHNKFTGQIPTTFGKLAKLTELYLDYNQLVARNNQDWAFFSALRNCRSLNSLSLSYNELQGPIP
jgi:Leucine-rich repeat (LRR) protein